MLPDSPYRPYVDRHRDAFLELFKREVRQAGISTLGTGMAEMHDLAMSILRDAGFTCRSIPTKGFPVIFAERRAANPASAPTVLLYGHYDVQPADPIDAWISPPFEPTVRDGRLYGRGAGDNKGQHLAHILGVQTAWAIDGAINVNVKMILEGEEEISSPNLASFAAENRELLAADFAITSDGPMAVGNQPVVSLGVRGIFSFELCVQGARFDNHSGNKGNVVPNPAWRLIEVMHQLRDADGRFTLPGFYDRVRPLTETEERLLRELPFDPATVAATVGLGVAQLAHFDGPAYYRRVLMEPTFTINGLSSGYSGKGHKTIIPARAVAKCDVRLVPDQDPAEIESALRAHLAAIAPDVQFVSHGWMRPSRTRADHPAVPIVAGALSRAHGKSALVQPGFGGSLPDYVFTQVLEMASLIVPYANEDEANHSPNENMSLDLFYNGIIATAEMLRAIGSFDCATRSLP